MAPKKIVTIAGSDILAGGGIQADLATFNEYGLFGLSVVTSIVTVTATDFTIHPIDVATVADQLEAIFALTDVAGIKVGLLPSVAHIKLVAQYLRQYAQEIPIIIDPVMAFKENHDVTVQELVQAFKQELLPLATVITPNLVEAEFLTDVAIRNQHDLVAAGKKLLTWGPQAVVVKGGARIAGNQATDVLVTPAGEQLLVNPKAETVFNNGAGCTFAAAIASQLVWEKSILVAVTDAKEFVYQAIKNGVLLNAQFKVGNVWQAARRIKGQERHEN